MSRTRNIIQEIAAVRARRGRGPSWAELSSRLQQLERAFHTLERGNDELNRYFPVALIACMEGFFRMALKELIDVGEPFLSRAEALALGTKIDFAIIRAVHGKSITVGELTFA